MRHLVAWVDDRPKDAVAFVAAVVFIGDTAFAGVVVVVMGPTGRLEGGLVQMSSGDIRGGRSGAVSLIRLKVAGGVGNRLRGGFSILVNDGLSERAKLIQGKINLLLS